MCVTDSKEFCTPKTCSPTTIVIPITEINHMLGVATLCVWLNRVRAVEFYMTPGPNIVVPDFYAHDLELPLGPSETLTYEVRPNGSRQIITGCSASVLLNVDTKNIVRAEWEQDIMFSPELKSHGYIGTAALSENFHVKRFANSSKLTEIVPGMIVVYE